MLIKSRHDIVSELLTMVELGAVRHECRTPRISCVANFIEQGLALGYKFLRMREFQMPEVRDLPLTVFLRIDVDFSLSKTHEILDLLRRHDVAATFFLRTRAVEYNLLSSEGLDLVDRIKAHRHEIGLHTELEEISLHREKDAADFLQEDLTVLRDFLGISVIGSSAHGSGSTTNNLDFWRARKGEPFGLLYEAYECSDNFNLFNSSVYISDSNWTYWKSFSAGKLVVDDHRGPCEHLTSKPERINLLIHPDTY